VFDYQIGGAYDNPAAKVVSRDRQDEADPDLYDIRYVNAFQTQPIASELQDWRNRGLTLKNAQGEEVIDGEWREILLDITTDAKRRAVASVVNGWIDGCADAGYQAVEPDNLDAFDRSEGLIDVQDTVAHLCLLIEHAHSRELAIARKNALGDPEDGGIGSAGRDAGLDFAVARHQDRDGSDGGGEPATAGRHRPDRAQRLRWIEFTGYEIAAEHPGDHVGAGVAGDDENGGLLGEPADDAAAVTSALNRMVTTVATVAETSRPIRTARRMAVATMNRFITGAGSPWTGVGGVRGPRYSLESCLSKHLFPTDRCR
jgi:hypothetical protein